MAVPGIPQNVIIDGNTISWDTVIGATSYNLYWKKDKIPNDYFTSIDNWTIDKVLGSETFAIVLEKLRIAVPSQASGEVQGDYDYQIPSGDFAVAIDFLFYTFQDPGHYISVRVFGHEGAVETSASFTYYRDAGGNHKVNRKTRVNGVKTDDTVSLPVFPDKIKLERSGTVMKFHYYNGVAWILSKSLDFGAYANVIDTIRLDSGAAGTVGGTADLDTLIITPSAKDSGTVITGITGTSYTISFIEGDFYCYEVTAVNDDGEGDKSLEINGTVVESGNYALSAKEITQLYSVTRLAE